MGCRRWLTAGMLSVAVAGLLPATTTAAEAATGPVQLGSEAVLTRDGAALVPVTIAFCLPAGEVEHLTVSVNQPNHHGGTTGGSGYFSSTNPPCVDNVQTLVVTVPGPFRRGAAVAQAVAQFCQLDATHGIPCGSPPPVTADITLVKANCGHEDEAANRQHCGPRGHERADDEDDG
jgi:hypothetical protein